VGKSKDTIEFDSKEKAEASISGYNCFQRHLKNFKVEKVK
jgi:hypothetical protein